MKMLPKYIVVGVLLVLSASCAAAQGVFRSDCTGILVEEDGDLQLKPEYCEQYHLVLKRRLVGCNTAVWCDASLEAEPSISKRVRAVCSVGDRCRIKGEVRGRGAFMWTEITLVRKLSGKK
jgi:hypothetical protein